MTKIGSIKLGSNTKDIHKLMGVIASKVYEKIGEAAVETFSAAATKQVKETAVTGRTGTVAQQAFQSFPPIKSGSSKQSLIIARLPAYFELLERGTAAGAYSKMDYPKMVNVSEEDGLAEWSQKKLGFTPTYMWIGGENTGYGKSYNQWFTAGVTGMKRDIRPKAIEKLQNTNI